MTFFLKNQIGQDYIKMKLVHAQCRSIENELDLYIINSTKIDRDLE